MSKAIDKFVPVIFQKLNTFDTSDTRFVKVKIWLMHLEENFNGSYFEKSVVEKAIPSLANTPILAYLEDNSEGELDFSDHRMVLEKKDGKFNVKYIGQAIGLIPESNNAKFEKRLCDDGIEREFLTVDGLVWQKWDDPIDIFNRDVIKAQSMELHSNYTGEYKEDNLYHFTSFDFFGACALGSEVLPAMQNATIEAQFTSQKVFQNIQEKMEQFKKLTSPDQEGGFNMDEVVQTEVVSVEENVEEVSPETTEEAVQEEFSEVAETVESEEVAAETETLEENAEEVVEEIVDYQALYEASQLEIETLKESFTKLEVEAEDLRKFKSTKLTQEREVAEKEIFDRFSLELTEDETSEVRKVSSDLSLEQLEEKLFTLVGKKKANFSKEVKKEKQINTVKIDLEDKVETKLAYGGLFERLGNKNK